MSVTDEPIISPPQDAINASASPLLDIPYTYARDHGVLLAGGDENRLSVVMRSGGDPGALLEVRRYLAMPFDVELVETEVFERLLGVHYAAEGTTAAMAGDFGVDDDALDQLAEWMLSAEDLLDSTDDAPIIRLINGIVTEAARAGASDIHIEPYETGLVVRMRLDGVLEEKLRMPPHMARVIVNQIKMMARLDVAQRCIPQDGCISLTFGGKLLDVRVSTLPNQPNERVVIRILDKQSTGISLDLHGMSDDVHAILTEALSKPNGIILVTGPTGSGKTTTLYAGLKQLNDGSRNILTIEDPVEHAIEGIAQTQVNNKIGLDFATGLRAIFKQDPDVVMVGEIPDRETAEIAIQASLTGHLVLSTVSANDAVGAITRMRDIKVEPFLLASTLRAVIAQRLVRRLCEHCRTPVQADGSMASLLGFDKGTLVYTETGCDACNHTGFAGHIGVFEAVRIDDTLRKLINEGGDEARISAHAFLHQPRLSSAARTLVKQGLTTPEEAIRISRRDMGAVDA